MVDEDLAHGLSGREADCDTHEDDVDDDEDGAAEDRHHHETAVAAVVDEPARQDAADAGESGRDGIGARVEDDLDLARLVDCHRDADPGRTDQRRPLPAEEEEARDDEDERERDVAVAGRVDRDGSELRDQGEAEEHRDPEGGSRIEVGPGDGDRRPGHDWQSGRDDGEDVPAQPGRQPRGDLRRDRHRPTGRSTEAAD